ncbi:MAG: RHS repeat-associated core domain-containing protein [bacterium]|nr:RHS repeat-associated core domain-containing protein [bacterium]
MAEITATYSSNELNQYTQISTEAGDETPAYDLDGNLTGDGTFQYDYNAENRLISVTPLNTASGLKKTEFAYDYTHRRISKQVYSDNTDTWNLDSSSSFVYDGWNLIKESTTTDAGNATEYYVWGLDLAGSLQGAGGIGGLLLRNTESGSYLYVYDANGNVGQLVDAADGAIAAHYEYDPFGKLLAASGPEADKNPFRFSTKYFDAETGLYYYGYRYYDPALGRWIHRDPIREAGFNLLRKKNVAGKFLTSYFPKQSIENTLDKLLYAFVLNNPIGYVDLYGLRVDESGCYRCGPDITEQLDATLDSIRNTL